MNECVRVSKQKQFAFKERGRKLILHNSNQVESKETKVDGCAIKDKSQIRCDYLLSAEGISMYIELKGQDIKHALKQIENTMLIFGDTKADCSRKLYIIGSQVPKASSGFQSLEYRHKLKYKSEIIVRTNSFEDSY